MWLWRDVVRRGSEKQNLTRGPEGGCVGSSCPRPHRLGPGLGLRTPRAPAILHNLNSGLGDFIPFSGQLESSWRCQEVRWCFSKCGPQPAVSPPTTPIRKLVRSVGPRVHYQAP